MVTPTKMKKTMKARQLAARGSARGGPAGSAAREATRRTKVPVRRTAAQAKRYASVQQAPAVAQALLSEAPGLGAFRRGRAELSRRCARILDMSFGRHEDRTPVPELRASLADLARAPMSSEAAAWVARVVEAAGAHLGAVNTDKSFKPFILCVQHVASMATYV